MWAKLIVAVAIAYLVAMLLLYFTQRSRIYRPTVRGLSVQEAGQQSLEKWPNTENYRGYLFTPAKPDKTFILFHGNFGEAADRVIYLPHFARVNARVLLAEYPGFGARPGKPTEKLVTDDSIGTLTRLRDTFPGQPVYVFGESLGSGVASAVVGQVLSASAPAHIDVKALGLITPFDSLVNVAQARFRWAPVKSLIKDRFDSVKNLAGVTIPKALLLSEEDAVVPVNHGQALFSAIPDAKRAFTITGAGHSNWMQFVDEQWWDEYLGYLLQNGQPLASENEAPENEASQKRGPQTRSQR